MVWDRWNIMVNMVWYDTEIGTVFLWYGMKTAPHYNES